MNILENCTPAQVEAITHIDGPLLVVAGAGSGKTRVITRRVAYLVQQGVKPWTILAITFTNKAAGEMQERIAELTGTKGAWVSTFHSMCARMLRRFPEDAGYTRDFTIYDAADSLNCVKACMKRLEIDTEHWTPATVQSAISNAKNDLLDAEAFEQRAGSYFQKIVARVYRLYEETLKKNQALDFDDLLLKVAKLLKTDTIFAQYWRNRFRYVLIDEYQDTNHAQYLIAKELAAAHRNICATGDPDQSIYGWRGADIRNIIEFVDEYPDAKVVKLEENFRSTKHILKAAEKVIVNNTERIDRALFTNRATGDKVRLIGCPDEEAEAEVVAAQIKGLRDKGGRYGDVAIFFRTNFQSRVFERVFSLSGIPYSLVGTVEFYGRKEIKDILAYLRLLVNDRDDLAAERCINTPPRGIGGQTLDTIGAWAGEQKVSLMEAVRRCDEISALGSRGANAIAKFRDVMAKLAGLKGSVAEIIDKTIAFSGYMKWLMDSKDERKDERVENLQELVSGAARFNEQNPEGTLQQFLEEVALVSQIDEYEDGDDRVVMLTVHAAKGLEFPVVFVTGVEEGLFPHQNSLESPSGVEEERRLAYVAITRAQKDLFITYALRRMRFGMVEVQMPSRFINEIPDDVMDRVPLYGVSELRRTDEWEDEEELAPPEPLRKAGNAAGKFEPAADEIEFKAGMQVRHPTFGRGRVIEVGGSPGKQTVLVRFDRIGVKRLMLEYAKLEKV